jgi:hypothetical protein
VFRELLRHNTTYRSMRVTAEHGLRNLTEVQGRIVNALEERAPGLNRKRASDFMDSETFTTHKLQIPYYVYKAFTALCV